MYRRLSGKNIAVDVTPREVTSATAVLIPSLQSRDPFKGNPAEHCHDMWWLAASSHAVQSKQEDKTDVLSRILLRNLPWRGWETITQHANTNQHEKDAKGTECFHFIISSQSLRILNEVTIALVIRAIPDRMLVYGVRGANHATHLIADAV
jgi:hypothetical protein